MLRALAAVAVVIGASWQSRAEKCVTGVGGSPLGTTQGLTESSPPLLRFAMCSGYSGDSCCLPIHENEVQDAYMHLVDTARTCPRRVNEQHPELRTYFCLFCNPKHLEYMSCCSDPVMEKASGSTGGAVFRCNDTSTTMYKAGSSCNEKAVNTVRLCKSFADTLFPGDVYDDCGMSIWSGDAEESTADPAAYNPNGIVPWGDVGGASADDPVSPSLFWTEGVKGFVRDIKPPLLDEFFIEVVDGEENCFKGAAAALAPGASVLAVLALAVAAVLQPGA